MPTYQAVSRNTHAGKRWQRYGSYAFAAGDALVPLVAQELSRAVLHLPIGFVASGEAFVPVAVQGLLPGRNLFVAADGRWLGGYVPAVYRGYPFTLAQTETGERVLCVDEDSGLLGEGPQGEAFFDEDGSVSKVVGELLGFLTQVQANREATARMCAALQRHRLIQPWPIELQGRGGAEKLAGLFRIDEAALNALPAEALHELAQAGALPLVYCQLLSMQHLPLLGKLAEARARAEQPPSQKAAGELDLEFLNDAGTISFGNL